MSSVNAQGLFTFQLRPTEDGCELLRDDGVVVLRARGRDARRRCLAEARAAGALRIRPVG